jgi:alkaline phosphatase D
MTLGRREFVVGSVSTAALVQLGAGCSESDKCDGGSEETKCGHEPEPTLKPIAELPIASALFEYGVASGDPLADALILWTRITKQGDEHTLRWVIAKDPALEDVVKSGTVTTDASADFTAKVDVDGLTAGTTYYYAFAFEEEGRSITGRGRTLPAADETRVRFAFTSCANYNNGYFHPYRHIAEQPDLDVWVHLGDYIYEYADGEYGDTSLGRTLDPTSEAISLADYRRRYAQVRLDPDLMELHRQHTCIVVWDDHEVADNASLTGAVNHSASEGPWDDRVAVGTRAFIEWLPLRLPDAKDPGRIYRTFEFGKLFDLIMIDTRLRGRDTQAGGLQEAGDPAIWVDPSRHLLGSSQEEWLLEALSTSRERGATWRLLGNQVMFAENRDPLKGGTTILNADAWDGYQPARNRVVSHVKKNGIDNLVVLTGDIHTSWALDLAENPFEASNYDPATGRGSFGVELVGPAVTSAGLEGDPTTAALAPTLLPSTHPHLKFVDVTRKGYVVVDVTDERIQADWFFVADHKLPGDAGRAQTHAKGYVCASKSAHLVEIAQASAPRRPAPEPASPTIPAA